MIETIDSNHLLPFIGKIKNKKGHECSLVKKAAQLLSNMVNKN